MSDFLFEFKLKLEQDNSLTYTYKVIFTKGENIMHMSDALITPVVGGVMHLGSAAITKYSLEKIKIDIQEKIPMMAMMGAFVFAMQMINFAIPGTGSSGHIGGGILLAIVLGPHAAFLTMGVILLIQSLFFGDGGLLALGCNIINLGFFTSYVAYPLVYQPLTKNKKFIIIASILTVVFGLQLGSFAVVIETVLSGRTALPFKEFLLFMQPIHLAIGLIEGVITAVIVRYLYQSKPDMIFHADKKPNKILVTLAVLTLLVAGGLSLHASSSPDGLEWAIEQTNVIVKDTPSIFTWLQEKFTLFADYELGGSTTIPGIIGSVITFGFVVIIGSLVRKKSRKESE